MSRLDLYADLHEHRPAAPDELRARVLEIAARAPAAPGRRLPSLSPRLALGTLLAAAAAVAIAVGVSERGSSPQQSAGSAAGEATLDASVPRALPKSAAAPVPPAGGGTRLQDVDATLALRVRNATALSDATKRALAIARSLGGFATTVNVNVEGREGDASIRVRVPVSKVQAAVERLSALGTITGSSLQIQDRQAGVAAVDREIARLQRQLKALRAREQTPATERQIRTLTARVQALQRQRAATVREARLATVSLSLTTRAAVSPPAPESHGRLHGVVVALTWVGVGAVYALALGGPLVLLGLALWLGRRGLRRRGERRLLER